MKVNQINNKAELVRKTLESVLDIESKGICDFDGPEGKKIQAKYVGRTASGSGLVYIEIPNNQTIKVVVTYAPGSGEEYNHLIAHKTEQNSWLDDLITASKENYFPSPFGTGSSRPITHHWSEYAGDRIDLLQTITTDVDLITAKLASALTANKETIKKFLGGKDFSENTRKIDAIRFDNPDTKRILYNYLDNATYKLTKAVCRYSLIEDILTLGHQDACTEKNKDILKNLQKDIEIAKTKRDEVDKLKNVVETATFDYKPDEFALIHSDLNLDNILVNKEKDYEISFIDGTLRERQTLQDYYGPKQIYYFIFKRTHEWLGTTGNATRETYAGLSQIFGNLLKILEEDYKIDEGKRDTVLKSVIDVYFDAFSIKKDAEKKYEKIFTKKQKTLTDNYTEQNANPQ
jgi:hypothetical protein